MKFKKPSEQKVKDNLALAGGLVAGSMGAKALFGFMHEPTTATDAASIKKDENSALLKRGVLAAAGLAGAMFIDGNDSLTTAARGTAAGVFVAQGLEIITTLAKRSGVEAASSTSSTGRKALANAVGLGCACTERVPLNAAAWAPRYPHSNMDYVETEVQPLNGWGGADLPGLNGWGSLDLQSA